VTARIASGLLALVTCVTLLAGRAYAQSPTDVVTTLYRWYAGDDRPLVKRISGASRFFTPELFSALENPYDTIGGISVRTCPQTQIAGHCKLVEFDPFSNSAGKARAYSVGAAIVAHGTADVPVRVTIAGSPPVESRIVVKLSLGGAGYRVSDLLYQEPRFYYIGPIGSLRAFLAKYNCSRRRRSTSRLAIPSGDNLRHVA
jgi:hypothetical protein